MLLTLYDQYGNEKAELQANDSSTQDKEVQADNVLSLGFTLYAHVSIDVNDYVDFGGERYWAVEKYEPAEKSSVEWEYSLKLYGIESLIKRFLVLNNTDGENEAVFTLTARPVDHVRLIVKCINEGMGTTDFKVGSVEGTDNVVINYEGKYCDEALKELAETVGVEWWFDGETLNLSRCEWGSAVVLGYGEGLTSLEQDKADNVKFYTRLYPIGSSRNIDRERYGAGRLQLPGGAKYVDLPDLVQKYGVIHHYEQEAFSGIYPRRVGVVSSVRSEEVQDSDGKPFTIYYFKDNGLTFDPNAYEIGGLVKHVSFQEGSELAGLGADNDHYFEVNFNSETREFEIITIWPYDDDRQLPGNTLVPKEGDKYILWNIRMPDEYYTLAETEFQSAVEEYNRKHTQDVSRYKGPTDHVWIEDTGTELEIGRRVCLKSQEYFPGLGYRESRITRISRSVNLPSQMDLEISDALSSRTLDKIDDAISDAKSYAGSILGAVNVPDVIKSWEDTKPTDNNLYSARKSEREFLSKRKADTAQKKITFKEGADFGEFHEGTTGAALYKDADGNWHCEADFLHARKKLTTKEVQVEEVHHVGGQQLSTAASMTCDFVIEREEGWRCFFRKTDSTGRCVLNKWKRGDQAYVCTFNLVRQSSDAVGNHYLWRLVTGTSNETADDSDYVVGGETINGGDYHFIDLSKTDFGVGSDAPQAGDDIVQLGYRPNDDEDRRNAILIAGAGTGSPYIREFTGIKDYHLPEAETQLKPGDNKLTGQVRMTAGSTLPDGTDIEAAVDKTALENAISDLKDDVGTLNGDIGKLENDVVNIGDDIDGLTGDVDKLGSGLDSLTDDVNNLTTGNENLLRNSGFTGDYTDEEVAAATAVDAGTPMYSDPLAHWTATNAEVISTTASVTGKAVRLSAGSLQQTLDKPLVAGSHYVFSFRAFGSQLKFSVGGHSQSVVLTSANVRYNVKFTASSAGTTFAITDTTATVMELQLIEGSIPNTDWINNPNDNDKALAYYQNLTYLANAIVNASTQVLGGLVLSQLFKVGNYRNGKMTEETGGMSGLYNSANSPFLWGGGSMKKAFYTISKYAENPLYQATADEVKNLMAQFVVTHGGRAILNDVIARGIVIATGGIFKNILTPNGNFKIDELGNMSCRDATIGGNMYAPLLSITPNNIEQYSTIDSHGYYVLNLDVTGLNVKFEGFSTNNVTIVLPRNESKFNGAIAHIYNNSIANLLISGAISVRADAIGTLYHPQARLTTFIGIDSNSYQSFQCQFFPPHTYIDRLQESKTIVHESSMQTIASNLSFGDVLEISCGIIEGDGWYRVMAGSKTLIDTTSAQLPSDRTAGRVVQHKVVPNQNEITADVAEGSKLYIEVFVKNENEAYAWKQFSESLPQGGAKDLLGSWRMSGVHGVSVGFNPYITNEGYLRFSSWTRPDDDGAIHYNN